MSDSNQYQVIVGAESHGVRLDKFLALSFADISRSQIRKLIEQECVRKNGDIIKDIKHKVNEGEEFIIDLPDVEPVEMRAANIPLDVVFENNDFLIIDKPAGLTVHPGAGNYEDTMANALVAYLGENLSGIGGDMRPGIVHRLDKDTSGLIVAAKNDKAHRKLARQIEKRELKRVYRAVCWGVPKPHSGFIEGNIGRSNKDRKKMAVLHEGGKEAVTHYKVLEIYGAGLASLIECRLETGRTHQIRVHLSHKGHPLIGDQVYSGRRGGTMKIIPDDLRDVVKNFKRQALHSYEMGVENPSDNNYIEFISDLPEDMINLINVLKGLNNK